MPIKLLFLYILQVVCSKINLNPNETRRTIEIKFLENLGTKNVFSRFK